MIETIHSLIHNDYNDISHSHACVIVHLIRILTLYYIVESW